MGEILTQLESTFNQDFKTLLYRPEEEKFDAIKKSFSRLIEYLPDIHILKMKNL
jgi:hypothetical protein